MAWATVHFYVSFHAGTIGEPIAPHPSLSKKMRQRGGRFSNPLANIARTLKRFSKRAKTFYPVASYSFKSVPELRYDILRNVHPSDCFSACCGQPPLYDGSLDARRHRRRCVVLVVLRCRQSKRLRLLVPFGTCPPNGCRKPSLRFLRALHPASAGLPFN